MNLKPGWFYCYNEKHKPVKNLIMKVCCFLRTVRPGRHDVYVYGVGAITVDTDQLEEFYLIRKLDLDAFCKQFKVLDDQKAKLYGRFLEQLSFLDM